MQNKRPLIAFGEWSFLLLLVGALMALNVPANWTGLAPDPDFTAWVSPLSNRVGNGLRLYDVGGHMPIPPASYVFLYWLTNGHATWLTESFLFQFSVCAYSLMIFACLANVLPRRVALLGAIGALATFSSTNSVLLYCSLPNFFSVSLACLGVRFVRKTQEGKAWPSLVGMGLLSAATILSKQNVGIMVIAGAGLLVLLNPFIPAKQRVIHLFVYVTSLVASFGLFCLAFSPWISVPGMINDVFLIGAECKGGTKEIILKLVNYSAEVGSVLIFTAITLFVSMGTGAITISKEVNSNRAKSTFTFPLIWVLGICLIGVFVALILARMQLDLLPNLIATEEIGLVACLWAVAMFCLRKHTDQKAISTFAILTIILLPAAAGYVLSAPIGQRGFYWYVHIIPFLQVALTAIVWLVFECSTQLRAKMPSWSVNLIMAIVLTVFVAQNWQPWRKHWLEIKNCSDTWNGVNWYANARITTNARPLEDLVKEVRSLTRENETVLLLPDDPNLEECFERPRPLLNCAIVFTDQYWLRYVSDDMKRLESNLPKLIIIGPKNSWREYSRLRNNSGAIESLIDKIQTELLPKHYKLVETKKINYRGGIDYLDIWQRIE